MNSPYIQMHAEVDPNFWKEFLLNDLQSRQGKLQSEYDTAMRLSKENQKKRNIQAGLQLAVTGYGTYEDWKAKQGIKGIEKDLTAVPGLVKAREEAAAVLANRQMTLNPSAGNVFTKASVAPLEVSDTFKISPTPTQSDILAEKIRNRSTTGVVSPNERSDAFVAKAKENAAMDRLGLDRGFAPHVAAYVKRFGPKGVERYSERLLYLRQHKELADKWRNSDDITYEEYNWLKNSGGNR